ncbi:hypothetical protein [Clostridium sp. Cult2]|nr:hypothetical protein [Clostridium sp. Cult2]
MAYIPEQGDIILIDFNLQAGHEQKRTFYLPAFLNNSKVKEN